MISVSLAASCLSMANISSCLRMALAFSTPASSAKLNSSVGVLTLRSCSFISLTTSCITKSPDGLRAEGGGKRESRGAGKEEGGCRTAFRKVMAGSARLAGAHEPHPLADVRRQMVTEHV